VGVDLRYLSQRLNEYDNGTVEDGLNATITNFPVPRSHSLNPGIFVDTALPVTNCLQVKAGARVDFVQTDIDKTPPTVTEASLEANLGTTKFDRDFVLWSAYVSSEYKVCDHWTALAGFGAAQRPPTLTELYADLPFIAAYQDGFPPTFVRGNPNLRPERLWQGDLGFRTEYEWLRLNVNGFAAWINDYITFDRDRGFPTTPLAITGANYVNTDLAFLVGGEVYGEVDLSDCLTPFIAISYVEGRDETRNDRIINGSGSAARQEALPSIPPLDTRVGVRLHAPGRAPRWAVEFTARIVDKQDQVANSLGELPDPHFTIFDLRSYWRVADFLTLTAGIENIEDRFYREHLDLLTGRGVFQPGRSVYVGMEWRR
jgi:outer membrane receptor protein involved in Fe transport